MRDYLNLTEVGTFDDLIVDMPVRIWDDAKPAKVLDSKNYGLNWNGRKEYFYFNWFNTNWGTGVVGFAPDLHLNQVWIESTWIFMILK